MLSTQPDPIPPPCYTLFKGTVAWDGFLAESNLFSVDRKNLKYFLICFIIKGDIRTFRATFAILRREQELFKRFLKNLICKLFTVDKYVTPHSIFFN
jgi:hypothetical protein